jgi:hypothetical protein
MAARYLQGDADVDEQGAVTSSWDAVPGAVPEDLQAGDVLVHKEQREDADVGVRPDAEHEVGPRAGGVVVEPGVRGALVAELVQDAVVVVELQEPGHRPEDPVLHSLAAQRVLVQQAPAKTRTAR